MNERIENWMALQEGRMTMDGAPTREAWHTNLVYDSSDDYDSDE